MGDTSNANVVSGVAVAVSGQNKERAQKLQDAMAKAVLDTIAAAAATGAPYPDDATIRAAMMAARERVKASIGD